MPGGNGGENQKQTKIDSSEPGYLHNYFSVISASESNWAAEGPILAEAKGTQYEPLSGKFSPLDYRMGKSYGKLLKKTGERKDFDPVENPAAGPREHHDLPGEFSRPVFQSRQPLQIPPGYVACGLHFDTP